MIREATGVRQAIIKEAANHDLVVMGASAQPTNASPDGRYLFGTLAESVASKARPTVIVVKTKQSLGIATFDELRASEGTLAHADAYVERSRSLPVVVDKWFAENTFHAHEFADIRKLVALKERLNLTISLGLPALNEEKTIGTVIKRVKARAHGPRAADRPDGRDRLGQRGPHRRDRRRPGRGGPSALRHPARGRLLHREGRGAVEEPARARRRHRGLDRHGHQQHPAALRVRAARPAAAGAAAPVREGLLPAADPIRRQAAGRGRRAGHRAHGAAAHQPLLSPSCPG